MSNTHFLSRSAHVDATLPIQPMRTRLRSPIRPTIAAIEFRNEHQPTMIRCIQMARKFSDLSMQDRSWRDQH